LAHLGKCKSENAPLGATGSEGDTNKLGGEIPAPEGSVSCDEPTVDALADKKKGMTGRTNRVAGEKKLSESTEGE